MKTDPTEALEDLDAIEQQLAQQMRDLQAKRERLRLEERKARLPQIYAAHPPLDAPPLEDETDRLMWDEQPFVVVSTTRGRGLSRKLYELDWNFETEQYELGKLVCKLPSEIYTNESVRLGVRIVVAAGLLEW